MRATIGITSGDPAGIGLEVVLKSISSVLNLARWVLFTDRAIFERNIARFPPNVDFQWVENPSELTNDSVLFLRDLGADTSTIEWGNQSPDAGRRAIAYLEEASSAALAGDISGIVIAPVNKEAIGGAFHGQTDLLADRAQVRQYAMSFFAPTFKVVLATVHLPLHDALAKISTDHYVRLIRFVHAQLRPQRLAVAAINPHAGEGGMFGRGDIDVLAPAGRPCAAERIAGAGPPARARPD